LLTLAGFLGPIGLPEAIVLLLLGLLIFGRRLPEVGRSLGKGIVEFRKGLSGIEQEVEEATRRQSQTPPQSNYAEREQPPVRAPLTDGGEDARVGRTGSRVATQGQTGSSS
jgi:TatA/E family protein of Tat protein translocase